MFANVNTLNSLEWLLAYEESWQRPAGQRIGLAFQARQFALTEDLLLSSGQVALRWWRPLSRYCISQLQGDVERRWDARSGFSHAWLMGAQVGAFCSKKVLSGGVFIAYGLDDPDAERPGGRQKRNEVILPVRYEINAAWALEGQFSVGSTEDANGYSPLLEANATRRSNRRNQRFLLLWQPTGHLFSYFLRYENINDSNDLKLFSQKTKNISMGLRHQFQ